MTYRIQIVLFKVILYNTVHSDAGDSKGEIPKKNPLFITLCKLFSSLSPVYPRNQYTLVEKYDTVRRLNDD